MKHNRPKSPSTLRPSAAYAYKSMFYAEDRYSDATIKVDYDTNRNPFHVNKVRTAFGPKSQASLAALERRKIVISRVMVFTTRKGHHIRIWIANADLAPVPAPTILRVQAALGDDPERQRFNAIRVRRGEPCWNVLWRLKIRNGKVLSREVYDKRLTDVVAEMIQDMYAKHGLVVERYAPFNGDD
jgi:hypothetical protein